MIYSRQYSRLTLALRGVSSASADGRCTIEIKNSKGRLIFNTYSLTKNKPYTVCFVAKGDTSKALPVGEINASDSKIVYFDPDDIGGKKIEDVAAVALIGPESGIPLIAGYTDDTVNLQRELFVAKKHSEAQKDQNGRNTSVSKKEMPSEPKKDTEKENKMPKVDFMEMFGKFRKEMEELEKMAAERDDTKASAEISENIVSETLNAEAAAEKSCINNDYTDYLEHITSKRENGEPYIENNENVSWYKISPSELSALPSVPLNVMTDPGCIEAYEKYGCILLGICPDNKYMVGILSEVPASQNSPFKQVVPSKDDALMCLVYTCGQGNTDLM